MKKVLVTGGTGFIGRNLVEKLLEKGDKVKIIVEPRYVNEFNKIYSEFKKKYNNIDQRFGMLVGDITKKDLGLKKIPEADSLYHLAAIYLIDVNKDLAEKVNVDGTQNVVDFVYKMDLEDFNYISTCYVSGNRKGLILEEELDKGQEFNNHYEETKFKAEMIVREHMDVLKRTRIFRPAITVGNSKTGETISFNGLYFAFDALNRTFMGYPALLALPGKGDSKVNFVPVDYLINAMVAIANKPETVGKTYQIADPNPLTANEIIDICCKEFKVKKPIIGHMPYFMAKLSFDMGLGKLLKIKKELIPYMDAQVEYDTTNTTEALKGTGIKCPSLDEYIHVIAGYWLKNK